MIGKIQSWKNTLKHLKYHRMYKEWPLGQLPEELKRPELQQLKNMGYFWDNPNEIIEIFEDVYFTPISIKHLISAILDLIQIIVFFLKIL